MHSNKEIIFLGERDRRDPLCRFYFDSLTSELALRGIELRWVSTKEDLSMMLGSSRQYIINFFYKDMDAINVIRHLDPKQITTICFCSDVENYAEYQEAFKVSDAFVCPSFMHKNILQYVYGLPIYVLREAIDPIFKPIPNKKISFASGNLVWFGFSESYRRSMVNVEQAIIKALRNQWINSFTIISSKSIKEFIPKEFDFLEYEVDKFEEQIQSFNFAILSHVPLDLHLNTYIKSPNKAISAIVNGVIPICSNTPNYRILMKDLKLESCIFNSSDELLRIFRDLPDRIAQEDLDSKWRYANEVARSQYSAGLQCDEYLAIIDKIPNKKDKAKIEKTSELGLYKSSAADIKLRFYLRQQFRKLKLALGIDRD